MSRIAKNPIVLPKGVSVAFDGDKISVKGPKGEMNFAKAQDINVELVAANEDKPEHLAVSYGDNVERETVAMAGTTRALLNNMVAGVSQGFERQLELVGVGYRAQVQGKKINLSLGFSHPVEYDLPEGVTAETPSQTQIVLKSIDKQQVGQVAAEIRSIRPPEPYKGKGVRYAGERIFRKETKKK